MAGVTKPTTWRARLRPQMDMGWMNDSLSLHVPRPDPPSVPPPPDDVLADVRLQRELPASAVPRRGRARQGLIAAQDAGDRWPSSRTCGRSLRDVGAPWQATAVHGR